MTRTFDAHCDVLYQLWKRRNPTLFFKQGDEDKHGDEEGLHTSYAKLKAAGVSVQTMAIFVPPEVPFRQKTDAAMEMLDLFHSDIAGKDERIHLLSDRQSLVQILQGHADHLYVLLSLEGADAVQDMTQLRTFYRLGIRSIGLTWNMRNLVADGVGERNPGGLSAFGLEMIKEMNRLCIAIDLSHLAERGFWDCILYSKQPLIVSHSNARALCDHPRNLDDKQIKAIFDGNGFIGVTFVPYFLSAKKKVTIDDVLNHVEHMLSLGGENHVGFGSDFDGISAVVEGLEHAGRWPALINACQKIYSETVVEKLFFTNQLQYYARLWNSSF